jgi:uncharacterized FlgJ-related protein
MTLNTFNPKTLEHKKVPNKVLILFTLLISLVILVTSVMLSKTVYKTLVITEEAKLVVLKEQNTFNEVLLENYIKDLNIKYPHIVLAQAKKETGHFKSEVFLTNHNLFGLKEAKIRATTAIGTNLNHAYYNNWRESILDYALYQNAYLKNVKTEDEYFQYLQANYAEDTNYVSDLKKMIK